MLLSLFLSLRGKKSNRHEIQSTDRTFRNSLNPGLSGYILERKRAAGLWGLSVGLNEGPAMSARPFKCALCSQGFLADGYCPSITQGEKKTGMPSNCRRSNPEHAAFEHHIYQHIPKWKALHFIHEGAFIVNNTNNCCCYCACYSVHSELCGQQSVPVQRERERGVFP